jgi:hypothetical protein
MGEKVFTMKSEVVGLPSVMNDDLFHSVDQKNSERRRFTISEVSCEFLQNSRTVLYEITTDRLGYHKFRATWVPKILMIAHKTQRMALTFFTAIPQRWRLITQSHHTSNK